MKKTVQNEWRVEGCRLEKIFGLEVNKCFSCFLLFDLPFFFHLNLALHKMFTHQKSVIIRIFLQGFDNLMFC